MKTFNRSRVYVAFAMMFCLLFAPLTAYAKKGEKNFNQGIKYEKEMKWDLAAQEFALALAANPSDTEYRLHYQRCMFNASQMFMQRARVLEEKGDYAGAYNAFRQAYTYDPVNELALSEMARVMRLQQDKASGKSKESKPQDGNTGPNVNVVPTGYKANDKRTTQHNFSNPAAEQKRNVSFTTGDLKSIIKQLAAQLDLNVIFDNTTFRQQRNAELFLKDVTTAQALDLLFLQEGLFFQKINRRTIIVADQTRRPVYQQLVIRTFYLGNAKPEDVRTMLNNIIPAQAGRMQTIIVPDKETNSVTIRDTAENVRLIGSLIQNIDKDRPEVVMDVNIYEVTKEGLLQLGNQVGTTNSLSNLGGGYGGLLSANNKVPFASALGTLGTTSGLGLLLPASALSAVQKKNNGRLLVSTQVHAFNNEESTARIGQRVPVQTASVFPTFGNGQNNNSNVNNALGGGYPVINYEPVGLTLKFTPLVFPNKDVQVKMSIESKDVLGGRSETPTFLERSITGTARIQNNRTMLLASINQERDSNNRTGLPILGLVPILGRLFTTPSQESGKTDIVIAVTPRVLRAPDITPRDEGEYESGTLQNPTPNSVQEMIRKEDEEEQLAMAESQPTNVPAVSITNANPNTEQTTTTEEVQPYVPATQEQLNTETEVNTTTITDEPQSKNVIKNTKPAVTNSAVSTQTVNPKSVVKNVSATPTVEKAEAKSNNETAKVETVKTETEPAKPIANHTNNDTKALTTVSMALALDQQVEAKSNKRRIALVIDVKNPLGTASMKLRFNPKMLAIRGVSNGNLFAADKAPAITPNATTDGALLSVTPVAGSFIKGNGVLVYIDVELLQKGQTGLSFDPKNLHFIANDGSGITVEFLQDIILN